MALPDSPQVVLETERLLLRHFTDSDAEALYVLESDAEIKRFFPEGTLTYEETVRELRWIIDVYYAQYGFGLWATIDKETGAFIGRSGLIPWEFDGRKEVEVAYLLNKAYWGQGLATEAARAIVEYGFEVIGLERLICLIDPAHQESRRVAEKLGMSVESEREFDGLPTVIYVLEKGTATLSH